MNIDGRLHRIVAAQPYPLGMEPGKHFGALLDEAFEAQLEGGFTDLDGALKWLDGRN